MCNRYECTEVKVSMMIVIKLFEKGGYFRRSTLSLNLIPCCQVVKYVVASARPCRLVEPEITNSLLAAN